MNDFKKFERIHGPAAQCEKVESDIVSKYRGRLPDAILSLWEGSGWCAYAQGLIWVSDPDSLSDPLAEWIDEADDPPVVIARTAFADLFFWGQDGVHFLNVHYGRITRISNGIEHFFDEFLCNPKNIQGVLRSNLFRQLLDVHGELAPGECYAFVPALAMGGSEDPETIEKVAMREHIGLLAQIVID